MRAKLPICAVLLATACAPTVKSGQVWIPEDQCWEARWLEDPLPFVSDEWEVYAVDDLGNCWYFSRTRFYPESWGPAPVSFEEACGEVGSLHLDCAQPDVMPW